MLYLKNSKEIIVSYYNYVYPINVGINVSFDYIMNNYSTPSEIKRLDFFLNLKNKKPYFRTFLVKIINKEGIYYANNFNFLFYHNGIFYNTITWDYNLTHEVDINEYYSANEFANRYKYVIEKINELSK